MTSKAENGDFEEKLKKLECPFQWSMEDIDSSIWPDYKPHDEEEFIPLLKLMRLVMSAYVKTKEEDDEEKIAGTLEKCNEVVRAIQEQNDLQFSKKAVLHVVRSTECHVYWTTGKKERAKKLHEEIQSAEFMDKLDRSTIAACRSIGWSKYHKLGSEEAVTFIRQALADNPECELWHFILAKNLRRIRRDSSVGSKPSVEERNAFLKAYARSKNVVYGIFVAQMYREEQSNQRAINMYEEILKSKPKCNSVYLRLALGFIQLNRMSQAKVCLDVVAVESPEDCMYLHYRGHYHLKMKKYTEAAYYLKKAAEMDNYPAAKEYLRCQLITNRSFDTTQYLLNLVERYKTLPEKQIQALLQDVALTYLQKSDLKNAMKYFSISIEIDPKSQALTEFYSCIQYGKKKNVYEILASEVFPAVQRRASSLDDDTLELYEELRTSYEEYLANQVRSLQSGFSNFRC